MEAAGWVRRRVLAASNVRYRICLSSQAPCWADGGGEHAPGSSKNKFFKVWKVFVFYFFDFVCLILELGMAMGIPSDREGPYVSKGPYASKEGRK